MFTVLIAAHNSERYIEQTLQSLRSQQFEDWQCIIVTNGCTDDTGKIVDDNSKNDSRISRIDLSFANKSAALNTGIIAAKREWIAILDADDLWTPDKLRLQYEFLMKNPQVDVLGTQIQYADTNSLPLPNSPTLPTLSQEIINSFDNRVNAIANSSVVYRRDLHKRFGYYDIELFGVEDYDWWKRLARKAVHFQNIKETCLLHRIHPTSNFNSSSKQLSHKNLVDQLDNIHKQLTNLK